MNGVTEARRELLDAFGGLGWSMYGDDPQSARAPGVIVGPPGDPYLTTPSTLGNKGLWELRQSVWLIAGKTTTAATREQLDEMIVAAVRVAESTGWIIGREPGDGIEAPLRLAIGSDTFTAARIPVAALITVESEQD